MTRNTRNRRRRRRLRKMRKMWRTRKEENKKGNGEGGNERGKKDRKTRRKQRKSSEGVGTQKYQAYDEVACFSIGLSYLYRERYKIKKASPYPVLLLTRYRREKLKTPCP